MEKKLIDYIDFERINLLLDRFNNVTGFVTAILDLEGNILSKSGWRTICTDFHRVHPETSVRCTESDTCLAGQLEIGQKYNCYKCLNGLIDVAVPIIINDEHVANLFSGQFFFEKPSRDFFIVQAQKYNFDKTNYLEALDKVPVVSEEKVKTAMNFLLDMTLLISEMTQQRIDQIELNKTLKESEERWQFAIEENGDGLFDWSIETNEVFYSKQWKAMLGFDEFEIENKFEEWENRVHPDDKAAAHEAIKSHFDGTTDIYSNEHRILCKDGSYKWILAKGKIISRTKKNKPSRLIGTHRDITEQKKSEYLIQESEEKYKALFDNAPLSYQSLDEEGRFIDINPSWLRTLGYEHDEVIGKNFADFLHPNWKTHFEKHFPAFKKRGYVNDVQYKIKHKKGHFIDISFEGCIGYLPDGSFKQTYCVFQDITEQLKTEEALRISEAKFRSYIDQAPDGIFITDENGKYMEVNSASCEVTGYSESELLQMHIPDLLQKSEIEKGVQHFKNVKQNGLARDEIGFVTKSGEERYWNISAVKLSDTRFLGFAKDITKRKQSEEESKLRKDLLRDVMDIVPAFICAKNLDGRFILINKKLTDFYGTTVDEMTGILHADICKDENELQSMLAADREVIESGKPKFIPDETMKNPDGSITFLDTYKIPFTALGEPAVLIASMDITDRKQAEKALFESEEKFRTFVNTASDLMCITNKDGQLTDVNSAMVDILDYSIEELKEMHISNLLTEEALKNDFNPNWGKFIEEGKINIETTFKTKYGNEIPGELKAIAIYNKVGQFIGSRAVFMDLTQRKQVEEALRKSETRLSMIVNQSPLGISVADLNGRYVSANPAYEKLIGYTEQELQNLTFYDLTHPDDRSINRRLFEGLGAEDSHDFTMEKRYIRKDGTEINAIIHGGAIFDATGMPQFVLGLFEDITERKQTEEELRKQKELFELVINSVPARIFWKDLNSVYLGCNRAFAEAVGSQTIEAIIGKNDSDLIWAEEAEKYIADDKQVIRTGISKVGYDENYTTPDGKKIWWHSSKMPLKDDKGKIFGILITSEDVTERRNAQEALKRSEHVLNETQRISKIGGWEYDVASAQTYFSDEVFNIYGIEDKKMFAHEAGAKFYHPDDRKLVMDSFSKAITNAEPYDLEVRFINAHKKHMWVRTAGKPIVENEKVVKLIGNIMDITERKEVENELLILNQLLKETGEIAKVGGWEYNVKTGEGAWTDEVAEIYDLDPSEKTNKTIGTQYYTPESKKIIEKAIQEAIQFQKSYDLDLELISAKGNKKWVRTIGHPTMDNGEVVRMRGSFQDITERKNAEKALIESEQRLTEAQRMASIGYWIQDVQSGKLIWSDETYRIFEVDKDFSDELYDVFVATIHPEDREAVTNAYANSLETKIPYEITHKLQMPDGRIKYVHERCETEYDESGNPVKSTGTVQDITELHQAEEELRIIQDNLEKLVDERTRELENKNKLLERMNKLFVGRELRMVELKQKIKDLEKKKI